MAYKAILVQVDRSHTAMKRIKLAAAMAASENAHLSGCALTGVSNYIYEAGLINDNDPNLTVHLSEQVRMLRDRARAALDEFERAARETAPPSTQAQMIDDEGDFSLLARCHDLVVVGQTDPGEPSPAVTPGFPEAVIVNCARPVLVVPYAGQHGAPGSSVLIAWDGSIGASRAVAAAIPLLRRAHRVEIILFNADPEQDASGVLTGDAVARYLGHHQIKAGVTRQHTRIDIGTALLSAATDMKADWMVMGAYGHSRLREMLLGGVTHRVLESMTIPVLMAH